MSYIRTEERESQEQHLDTNTSNQVSNQEQESAEKA